MTTCDVSPVLALAAELVLIVVLVIVIIWSKS
jgi:hypothetical protein